MCWSDVYQTALKALIKKSGATEWTEPEKLAALKSAAIELANAVGECEMALPDFVKRRAGTPIVLAASGGDFAISLASVASVPVGTATTTGARQGETVDFRDNGGNIPDWVDVHTEFELAATPTAGNAITIQGPFSAVDPDGYNGTLGTDSAYTGFNNNADASMAGLPVLAAHICTANATATIQKKHSGGFRPSGPLWNPIVRNMSGAAFHSTNTNQRIVLTPYYNVIQDTEAGA